MRLVLYCAVLFLICFSLILPGSGISAMAKYEMGRSDMAINAGMKTVTPPKRGNTILIDAAVLTRPWILGRSDTEYVLQNDVYADGTAFEIRESNITLNLNGHTIVYLDKDGSEQTNGVFLNGYNLNNDSVVNGTIVQGDGTCLNANGGNTHELGNACNPVYGIVTFGLEIAGLHIVYKAPDTSGIFLNWGNNNNIHDNTIEDLGNQVTNRHQGVDAVKAVNQDTVYAHHNLIKGARQVGIRTGANSEVYNNEVHIESVTTNSSGINVAGGSVHHNKVYGRGVHPIGIWPGTNIKVYSNYTDIESDKHGTEYESPGAACVRMTWSNDNVEVMYNTFVLHESGDFKGRALWLGLLDPAQKAEFHDNIIVANNRDGRAKAAAIDVDCNNESPNLVFRSNKVISNWGNVVLSDEYGYANGYARFIDNTFIRQDNYPNYLTIRSQYSSFPSTAVFINNKFENGASLLSMDLEFFGSGNKEIAIAWYLDVVARDSRNNPVANAAVSVQDNTGRTVFNGATDSTGKVRAEIFEYLITNGNYPGAVQSGSVNINRNGHLIDNPSSGSGRNRYQLLKGEKIVVRTPHTITVSKGGRTAAKTMKIQRDRTVRIVL